VPLVEAAIPHGLAYPEGLAGELVWFLVRKNFFLVKKRSVSSLEKSFSSLETER